MDSQGQLHDPEVGPEVAAGDVGGDRLDDERADLCAELHQLRRREGPEVGGTVDAVEDHGRGKGLCRQAISAPLWPTAGETAVAMATHVLISAVSDVGSVAIPGGDHP